MKKSLIALFATIILTTPVVLFAAEQTLATLEKIDTEVSKNFPGFRPCLHWQQESTGLRRVYADKPGIDLFKDVHYLAVTIQGNTAVLKYEDRTYILDLTSISN